MIKTIIFDLAEVILTGFYGVERFLTNELNLEANKIKSMLQGAEYKLFMEGKINEEDFWSRVITRNNWDIKIDLLKRAIRANFQEIEGTRKIIEDLKEKGYELVLLSDHSKEWIDYCSSKFDYHHLFDYVQYSYQVKACKIDRVSFDNLLREIKRKPENCLFIDDNEKNLKVAESLGIRVIQFLNPNQLDKDLAKVL
ncbi:MAG: HAD family phosphatase [Nanoarchaeota archaeon]|nr:HAD family phosphatase [Nanoarchaeota archaeon]